MRQAASGAAFPDANNGAALSRALLFSFTRKEDFLTSILIGIGKVKNEWPGTFSDRNGNSRYDLLVRIS